MKKLATIVVLTLALPSTAAFAADLAATKAPPAAPAMTNGISGFYIGVNGGYGGGDLPSYQNTYTPYPYGGFGVNLTRSSYRAGGALAGGQLGYNYIYQDRYLIGGEVDVDWADVYAQGNNSGIGLNSSNGFSSSGVNVGSGKLGMQWIGTGRVRLGYQIGALVPFISGGVAFGGTNYSSNINYLSGTSGSAYIGGQNGNNSTVSAGWAVGAGVEYSVTQNWSLKTEYLYTQISAPSPQNSYAYSYQSGYVGPTTVPAITGGSSPIGVHQVRFGVNYHPHLFEAAPVLAAKY